jgi:hypothetical protein
MTLSILALCFLLLLIAIIFYGYGFIMKSARPSAENMEQCTICRVRFYRQQLVEREIGDSKLIYFCKACILRLYNDAT